MRFRLCLLLIFASLVHAQAPARKAAPARRPPAAAVPSRGDLTFPPLRQVQIPQVSTFTLANGMKLYLLEDHELPLVSGFALVRTGALFDPPGKIGLAEMTAVVLRTGGTKDLTGDQIDETLENVAASVESQAAESNAQVSVSALRENIDEVLTIFRDLLAAPEFRPDKIELAKTQMRGQVARRNDNPGAIAAREFFDIVHGKDTPYGARVEYEHINRITRQDLVDFHRRYFFPGNVMLALYGDFSIPEMQARIEKLFGAWNARGEPVPPFPDVRDKPQPGIYLATKNDVTQTFLRMGHLGGLLKDKNYPALEVMAQILGGSFSSRLFRRVRGSLGYAYSVSAAWIAGFNQPGLFEISCSTKSLSTLETIEAIGEEIVRIRTSPVTDQELQTAKDTVANSFVFNFDTPSKTLLRLIRYEYYGYPKDLLFQYQKGVAAVTREDILRVARQYLKPENLTIVAVGKPSDFGRPLGGAGLPLKNIDLTIPEPKLEVAPADAASLRKGRELLARVQQALGGADKLAAVKDYTQVLEMQFPGMQARQTNRWIAPSHLRQENEFPFGRSIIYCDGTSGWLWGSSPPDSVALTGPHLKQAQALAFRSIPRLVLSDRDATRTVNYAGEGMLEISDKEGNWVRLTVDEKTAMPLRISYQNVQLSGSPIPAEEVFGDWKETSEIRLPYRVTIVQGGTPTAEITVQDWLINSGLQVEVISKRP